MAAWSFSLVLCVYAALVSSSRADVTYPSFYATPLFTTHTLNLTTNTTYAFTVNALPAWNDSRNPASGFVFQVHAQRSVTLQSSHSCSSVECQINGTHIGMTRLFDSKPSVFYNFYASLPCDGEGGGGGCGEVVSVMVALVPIPVNDPIPAGCTLTSGLEIDAHIATDITGTYLASVSFQDSNIGFWPQHNDSEPVCDDKSQNVDKLAYRLVYHCRGALDFDPQGMFDDIKLWLTADGIKKQLDSESFGEQDFSYLNPKRHDFRLGWAQSVIYSVITQDTSATHPRYSAYIPSIVYGCSHGNGELIDSCRELSPLDIAGGVLAIVAGLFLCFGGHNCFPVEVVVFVTLILFYFLFMLLSSVTPWTAEVMFLVSICVAFSFSLFLLLTLWLLLGWYLPHVLLFSSGIGFLVAATVLFSPIGSVSSVLEHRIVYGLILGCVSVAGMIPLAAFPSVNNIISSSFVGGYTLVFGVGMFYPTELSDIAPRVIHVANTPELVGTKWLCPLSSADIAFCCVWAALLVFGSSFQILVLLLSRHRRRRAGETLPWFTLDFPKSPFKRWRERKRQSQTVAEGRVQWDGDETRPLISPSSVVAPGQAGGQGWPGDYSST